MIQNSTPRWRGLPSFAFSLLTVLIALGCLYPLLFAALGSLKTSQEIFGGPFNLPSSLRWENYPRAWETAHLGVYFLNTVLLTVSSMALSAVLCWFGAFVLARIRFRLSKFFYVFFIAGMMVPIQITIIPLAYVFGTLQLNDSYLMIILLFTAFNIPLSMLIMTGFLRDVPTELEEAAVIDGCSPAGVLFRVLTPISAPALASASIFNFIAAWNNLLIPLIFINKDSLKTIPIGLLSFVGMYNADYGGLMAAVVIAVFLPVVAYLLLQEKVERGLTDGAIKG
jgi:raffinose/stachyose/melibiose transport system permease protein